MPAARDLRRRPTILDVAAAAGVSKSLVSLALRDDPGVSARTRERILDVARDLGYRQNSMAQALVQGRSGRVGVLMTDLANPYHTEVVAGIEDALDASDMSALIGHGRRDTGRLEAQLERMLELRVDAVIVVSSWIRPDRLAAAAAQIPLVVVGRLAEPPAGLDTVANDDALGSRLATEHLIGLGHRRIAHLAGSGRPASAARESSYRATMTEHGLDRYAHVDRADPDLTTATARLLESPATAVVASNDLRAAALVDAAHEAGRALPEHLSVVGYDNSMLARVVRPHLTSVDQPRAEMGARAAVLVTERLAGRGEDRHEVLQPRLVVRDSTVPPAT